MQKCKIAITSLLLVASLIIGVAGCTTTASKTQSTPGANFSQGQANALKQNANEQNKNEAQSNNVMQNTNMPPNIIEKYHITISKQPFSPYPTEKEIFARPAGNIKINGIQVSSFGHGMEITWKDNGWEYFVIGHDYGDGKQMAQEVLTVLPKGNLIKNSIKGKLRFVRLGNPTYFTASWTYDGDKWYTLQGKGLPGDAVKILQSIK